ncbi:MAG: hypothetical protein V9F01_06935 [Chitinophagaceae bacterium]
MFRRGGLKVFTVIGVLKYGGTKCWERTNRKDSLLYVVLLVEENTNNGVDYRFYSPSLQTMDNYPIVYIFLLM